MDTQMRWYHSVAVKSCLVAFVATHIPLLGLIALIVVWPQMLSPWGVFLVALALTLLATALVIGVLWRMFRPLRDAADGLRLFMTGDAVFRGKARGTDEIARLVQVLVRSLAHLDRSRAGLLHSSAIAVGQASAELRPVGTEDERQWLALLEADAASVLDGAGGMEAMLAVHYGMDHAVQSLLTQGEMAMPWGRGRFLVVLKGSGADAFDRLEAVCRKVVTRDGETITASAALEPERADPQSRAAALQRLEHKLFGIRARGLQAAVA